MDLKKKISFKDKSIDAVVISSIYIDYVIENGKDPVDVFSFCKSCNIDESVFCDFFGSLLDLRQNIWVRYFDNAILIVDKHSANYQMSAKEELVLLLNTLFDNINLNKNYLILSLTNSNGQWMQIESLKLFSELFKEFLKVVLLNNYSETQKQESIIPLSFIVETTWLQFLLLLRYWFEDSSEDFEKTKGFILKTVDTTFKLASSHSLDSILEYTEWLEKI